MHWLSRTALLRKNTQATAWISWRPISGAAPDIGESPLPPIEIVGGSYIAERFGDWKDALRAAHLNPIYKKPRNRDCGRYQNEKNIQIQLHRSERDAKRAARVERVKQRQSKYAVHEATEETFVATDVMLE